MVKSIKIYKNFDIKLSDKGSIILIGNFDGLHLGHQKLFKLAKNFKKKYSIKIGVLTFEPMPKMFFNHKLKNFRISNQKQKINLLKSFNVDFVIVKKFDRSFSKTKSINFIKKIIGLKLKPRFIFVSNNFRFGNKREGNVNQLIKHESECNFKIIKPKPLTKSKKIISSTFIRKLIQNGNLSQANKFLGRTWTIQGKVSKGRQLGKKIGFPTANIKMDDYIIPKLGVYAVRVKLENSRGLLKGIANIGYRPTFNQKKILLEVNLFNFNKNIYNKKLTVEFLKFIRKEKKFNGINDLRKQINIDLVKAKKVK